MFVLENKTEQRLGRKKVSWSNKVRGGRKPRAQPPARSSCTRQDTEEFPFICADGGPCCSGVRAPVFTSRIQIKERLAHPVAHAMPQPSARATKSSYESMCLALPPLVRPAHADIFDSCCAKVSSVVLNIQYYLLLANQNNIRSTCMSNKVCSIRPQLMKPADQIISQIDSMARFKYEYDIVSY